MNDSVDKLLSLSLESTTAVKKCSIRAYILNEVQLYGWVSNSLLSLSNINDALRALFTEDSNNYEGLPFTVGRTSKTFNCVIKDLIRS